uniref:Uncharacterized protein n=1 Tax=Rhizophora mucronata TaxID=61149 RepID=A0A2P2K175_RHIMU
MSHLQITNFATVFWIGVEKKTKEKMQISCVPIVCTQSDKLLLSSRHNPSACQNEDNGCSPRTKVKFSLPAAVEAITSPSNPFVKHCVKLGRSSPYRQSHASALIVGTTPIRYFLGFHCYFFLSYTKSTIRMGIWYV